MMSNVCLKVVKSGQPHGAGQTELKDFQESLLRKYTEYCECLNFSPKTISAYDQFIRNVLKDLGLTYIWEITGEEIRRYNLILIERELTVSTRSTYCYSIKSLFRFLLEEHTAEIKRLSGISIQQPIRESTAPRIRYCRSYGQKSPPNKSLIRKISQILRNKLPMAGNFTVAARNLVIFEMFYLTALRANELIKIDVTDIHFRQSHSGQIHIRQGKGTRGSGPRHRWIPMLDGLDELLHWYLRSVRPKFKPKRKQNAIFLTNNGGRISYQDAVQTLEKVLNDACIRKPKRFTLHQLRHARASHLFEDGMNLVAIQKFLGHAFITTTQRYVHVDPAFIDKAHKKMVQRIIKEGR